jgi:hypothetical protein
VKEAEAQCPFCHGPLTKGYVELAQTLYGAIFGGGGSAKLQFAAPAQPEIDVLGPASRSIGFCCTRCNTVVIPDEVWLP